MEYSRANKKILNGQDKPLYDYQRITFDWLSIMVILAFRLALKFYRFEDGTKQISLISKTKDSVRMYIPSPPSFDKCLMLLACSSS